MASRRRVLLVGEAPARDSAKRGLEWALVFRALGAPRPWAFAQLSGSNRWAFDLGARTRHLNVLPEWPGAAGRGASFPMHAAWACAAAMLRVLGQWHPYDRVLLAGWRVSEAFGHPRRGGLDYFRSHPISEVAGVPVHVVPHPSGVNRWWDDAGNRARAVEFLERTAREVA